MIFVQEMAGRQKSCSILDSCYSFKFMLLTRYLVQNFELICILTEPNQALKNIVNQYGKENLSLLHILIQSPYITKIKRDVAMTFTNYVANTGGLLGLCLGFSFISGVEILYWCCFSWKQIMKCLQRKLCIIWTYRKSQ